MVRVGEQSVITPIKVCIRFGLGLWGLGLGFRALGLGFRDTAVSD